MQMRAPFPRVARNVAGPAAAPKDGAQPAHTGRPAGPELRLVEPAPAQAPPPEAKAPAPAQGGALDILLGLERKARGAASARELAFTMVNETRKLNGARHTMLLRRNLAGTFKLSAASSIDTIEADAPFTLWIEKLVARHADEAGLKDARDFALPAYCDPSDAEKDTYPFRHLLFVPFLSRDGAVFAGLLCARETPWTSGDVVITKWLAEAFAHAAQALDRPASRTFGKGFALKRWHGLTATAVVCLALVAPVTMSALAPVEVIAARPTIVAAPFDGAIEEVLVEPNAPVKAGTPLFRFVDVALRNKFEAAEKAALVAEAKYRRASQAAFGEAQARHEMTIAAAEMALANSERDFARELLGKSLVKAETAGVAVFASKDDWKGRPVTTGERVMQIAQPGDTALRVDLPVKDAIVLTDGARVKVYLDSAPLNAMPARVVHASYQAEPTAQQQLAYRVRADFDTASDRAARIGARGTAEVFGGSVPLVVYLFRRPITAARQFLGL